MHSFGVKALTENQLFSWKDFLIRVVICVSWSVLYFIAIFIVLALFVIPLLLHISFPKFDIFSSGLGSIIGPVAIFGGPILLGCLEERHHHRAKINDERG
jgi:hypothetical protein